MVVNKKIKSKKYSCNHFIHSGSIVVVDTEVSKSKITTLKARGRTLREVPSVDEVELRRIYTVRQS